MSTRIQSGDTVPIVSSHILDNTGATLTLLTDIEVRIRRESDNEFYDWSDETFKETPTDLNLPLSESSIVSSPGIYTLNTSPHTGGWDTSQITNETANDTYTIEIIQITLTNAATVPQIGEIIIDQWVGNIDVAISTVSGSVWDEPMAAHTGATGVAGRLLNDASGNLTNIADSIWEETRSDHISANTFGQSLQFTSSFIDITLSTISGAVWNELRDDHTVANSFGESVALSASGLDTSAVNEISASILADSNKITGSFIDVAISSVSSSVVIESGALDTIASVIWDEPTSEHSGAGTFGEKVGKKLLSFVSFIAFKDSRKRRR